MGKRNRIAGTSCVDWLDVAYSGYCIIFCLCSDMPFFYVVFIQFFIPCQANEIETWFHWGNCGSVARASHSVSVGCRSVSLVAPSVPGSGFHGRYSRSVCEWVNVSLCKALWEK